MAASEKTPPDTVQAWQRKIDAEVLAQARADREKELELARIESSKVTTIEQIRANDRSARRTWWGGALVGLGIIIVILGVITAIWTAIDRDRGKAVRLEEVRQQTAQACIKAGNIWTAEGACLLTQRQPTP
jgi:hypothetical protein